MPTEVNRVYGFKTITLPDESTVKINVILQITWQDEVDRYQETQHTIDNTLQNQTRKVHVDQVAQENTAGSSGPPIYIFVERIDQWNALDSVDRYQETDQKPDNKTGEDSQPPHFTTHLKTHVVRFVGGGYTGSGPSDGFPYVDTELIDEYIVQDPVDRYQETHYYLKNPMGTDDGQGHMIVAVDSSAKDVTNEGGEGDQNHPVRTDPFQNIIGFNGNPIYLIGAAGASSGVDTAYEFGSNNPPYEGHFEPAANYPNPPWTQGGIVSGGGSSISWQISGTIPQSSGDPGVNYMNSDVYGYPTGGQFTGILHPGGRAPGWTQGCTDDTVFGVVVGDARDYGIGNAPQNEAAITTLAHTVLTTTSCGYQLSGFVWVGTTIPSFLLGVVASMGDLTPMNSPVSLDFSKLYVIRHSDHQKWVYDKITQVQNIPVGGPDIWTADGPAISVYFRLRPVEHP